MFTKFEQDLLGKRLPMAATKVFLRLLEKADHVPAGTYENKIDFSEHADVKLADRVAERDNKTMMPKREKPGFDDFKAPEGVVHMMDPMKISPIVPLEVRQQLAQEQHALYGTEPELATPDCKSPVPEILTESKEQEEALP